MASRSFVSDAGASLTFSAEAFEIQRLFSTPFLVAPVNDFEPLNEALTRTILQRAALTPGVARSNAGGWQSGDDFQVWGGQEGAALLEAGRRLADSVTAIDGEGGLAGGGPEWRINAWANLNMNGHANHAHHHPASFWSGVYWVDAGEDDEVEDYGGEFEMHDPRGILPAFYAPRLKYAVPGCLSAGHTDFFFPRTGTMVLFPSWLVHAVRPYTGRRRRISIAFNLSV